ncbi:unnamed protein product [Prorocentrum cordatum]|uniref:Reverse transcriptase domain-containing protein n=1 Tax=Prorocentrum cordatum TaxID=2364126 RepID=A0ABN9PNU5_9DINO|nr:unnamed protein product [Polarella glacialis]
MAKALGMIRLARTEGWAAACLSDVHCPWEFTDYHSLPGAPRDLRNTVVAIEEFIVIFCTRSAILLSPAAQQAWRDHECHVARHECGRLLTVSLRIKGASCAITSVYAPDQSYGADLRRDFFELCDEVRLGIPASTSQLWLGNWNNHIGVDSCQHYSGLGRYGMNTPAGTPGRELAAWLAHGPQLDLIDSYFKIRPRGTWSHPVGGRHIHFELDVCAASSPLRRRFSRVKTFQVEFSDHCGKTYHLALAKAHEAWRELRQLGAEAQKRPLALHRMQGSLPEAVALREQYVRLCEDRTPPLDENCPLFAIRDIAAAAAEEVVGRESKRWCTLYLAGHAREMQAECDALRELRRRQRLAPTTEESTALRQQHRARSQAYRALRRKWRAEWISGMVTELERSMQFHDMGRFYATLRELGVKLQEYSQRGRQDHTPEALREHYSKLGAEVNTVSQETLDRLPPPRPTCAALGDTPSSTEILAQMQKMKNSAGGKDEITIKMLLHGGDRVVGHTIHGIQHMWVTPPQEREAFLHEAVVISLWKRKGDPQDLDKHRDICLISIFARIIARVLSARLTAYCEEHHVLANDQWGFRPMRSTLGAVSVVRRLVDLACHCGADNIDDPICVEPLDMQKAYPSAFRNAAEVVERNEGIPEAVIQLEKGLTELTEYVCRNKLGYSKPYKLLRGFKEGCPACCVRYNIYHNAGLRDFRARSAAAGLSDTVQLRHAPETVRIHPLNGMHGPKWQRQADTWERFTVDLISFADDTNLVHRASVAEARRDLITSTMNEWGETVHPDKWQHLRARRATPATAAAPAHAAAAPRAEHPPRRRPAAAAPAAASTAAPAAAQGLVRRRVTGKSSAAAALGPALAAPPPAAAQKWDPSIELLGSWISADGTTDRNLYERLTRARKLWYAVYRRLPSLGLSAREKGKVVQATVMASLLYACEVTPFNTKQLDILQRFQNRVVRAVTMSSTLTIRTMKGRLTQTDLRLWTGMDSIRVQIIKRTLGWIGHVCRRGSSRLEYRMLRGWLDPECTYTAAGRGLTWKKQVDDWLRGVEALDGQGRPWHVLATTYDDSGSHHLWDQLLRTYVEAKRKSADQAKARIKPMTTCECGASMPFETWREATRRRTIAEYGEATVNTWPQQCPHCGLPFRDIFAKRVHVGHCKKRRQAANLPLDGYPGFRQP